MRHYPVKQGSDEWLRMRMGKPTASEFEKLITPAKKENQAGAILGWQPTKSETRRNYAIYLLTELILDQPLSGVTTGSMKHGHDWEGTARAAYQMKIGLDVEEVGFCVNDEHTYGASPDGFVGSVGSVEIKCPHKPEIHVGYMMDPASLVEEYFAQTQGQLFVTGREWTDLIAYFGGLPMVKERVFPIPEFQTRLGVALNGFCDEFAGLVERCYKNGWLKGAPPPSDWITADGVNMVRPNQAGKKSLGDFDITDEEIQRIWNNRSHDAAVS